MISIRVGALSFLLLVSMGACTPRPVPHDSVNSSLTGILPETILTTMSQRWQAVETLRTLARTTITSAQGRYSARQTLLWRRPASLRLDTLSLFGQPTMTLVADPAGASIYYPQQEKFFQGPATATTFARVIGLPLGVEEVAPLLVGSLQLSPTRKAATIHLQPDGGMYLLRFLDIGGQLIQDVWVDPDQLLPRRAIRYTTRGVPAVDIAYSDFRPIGDDVLFPFELIIWVPAIETEVRLQFLTVDCNPGLPPTLFQLSPPASVPVTPLE